jgi:pheromone shutdown protein TraB
MAHSSWLTAAMSHQLSPMSAVVFYHFRTVTTLIPPGYISGCVACWLCVLPSVPQVVNFTAPSRLGSENFTFGVSL